MQHILTGYISNPLQNMFLFRKTIYIYTTEDIIILFIN